MTEQRDWTLWVFAGPQALSGLHEDGDKLGFVETPAGEHVPITAAIQRALGGEGLPPGVRIIAETVGEPTLLQKLTREWPATRMVFEPGQAVADVVSEPGQRDLQSFVAWAQTKTPPGSRRALVLLGDVLRAIGDEPPAAVDLGPYRPCYPKKVTITKSGLNTIWNYVPGEGWNSGNNSNQLWSVVVEATRGSDSYSVACNSSGDQSTTWANCPATCS